MAKVTIEIDERYASVLSITAVGVGVTQTSVTTTAVDLSKCNYVSIGANGKTETKMVQEGE